MYFGDEMFELVESTTEEKAAIDFMADEKATFNPDDGKPDKSDKGKKKAEKPAAAPIAPKKEKKELCDPFAQPGFYEYTSPLDINIKYKSLNTSCEPFDPSPVSALKEGLPFELLQDKTAVLIGDSVDRQNLDILCTYIGGKTTISDQDSHEKAAPGESGGYPRLCYVEKYNLSISNYFFYGFDQDSIWTDKENVFLEPGDYLKRIGLAEKAIGSLHRQVDVGFINVGFWELARIDRLDANKKVPEAAALRADYLTEYQTKLKDFLIRIAKILPKSRLIFRETNYPMIDTGPFFSTPDTINRKHRFHNFKVRQINEVAKLLTREAQVEFWPIGSLVRDMPPGDFMLDDRKLFGPTMLSTLTI